MATVDDVPMGYDPITLRILGAALGCIGKLGFDKVRIEDIVREAGASRATVYRRFATREQIFLEMLIWLGEPFNRQAMQIASCPAPYLARLQAICELSVADINGKDWLKAIVHQGVTGTSFELLASSQEEVGKKILFPFLEAGIRDGLLRCDLRMDEIKPWLLWTVLRLGSVDNLSGSDIRRLVSTFVMPVLASEGERSDRESDARLGNIEQLLSELRPLIESLKEFS